MIDNLQRRARTLKREVHAIALAATHPRTPPAVKVLAVLVAAYALSPIDLIPDFIPILGYLDDLLLIPAGIGLVLRMIPPDVMKTCRLQAAAAEQRPRSRLGAAMVIAIWLIAALLCFIWLRRFVA